MHRVDATIGIDDMFEHGSGHDAVECFVVERQIMTVTLSETSVATSSMANVASDAVPFTSLVFS
jgi:hypothetical protein